MKLTCAWCIFRFILKFALAHLFFNCGYLFCFTYRTMKTARRSKERREKEKQKKTKFSSKKKKIGKGHSFMTSSKMSKIRTLHVSPQFATMQFRSELPPPFDVLNWDSLPPGLTFHFLENFNNKVNIVKYSLLNMHAIYTILVTIKLTGKRTDFHLANFCERLI